MKVLYYEVSDGMVKKLGGKYFRYRTTVSADKHIGPRKLAYGSDRIWEWDLETDQVRYIKHRETGTMTKADRKEFFLIQLRAEEY